MTVPLSKVTVLILDDNPIVLKLGRALLERRTVHIRDTKADSEYNAPDVSGVVGNRALMSVPLLREAGDVLGQVQIGYQRIDSFHKLVVDQLPYGQIDPANLVQGLIELDGPDQDDPPIGAVGLARHPGVVEAGEALRQLQVVGVRVRHEHDAHRVRGDGALQGRQVPLVVGAGVDHDQRRPVAQDPRVGAGAGVRARVGRHHAPHGCHPSMLPV